MKNSTILLSVLIALFTISSSRAEFTDEEFHLKQNHSFRNYMTLISAIETYVMEFRKLPVSPQELENTDHLQVKLANPYTGGLFEFAQDCADVQPANCPGKPGEILVRMNKNGVGEGVVDVILFYLRKDGETIRVFPGGGSGGESFPFEGGGNLSKYLFNKKNSPEERKVLINAYQLSLAITASFFKLQRYPVDLQEFRTKGDFWAEALNPFTGQRFEQVDRKASNVEFDIVPNRQHDGQLMEVYAQPLEDVNVIRSGNISYRTKTRFYTVKDVYGRDVPARDDYFEVMAYGKNGAIFFYSIIPDSLEDMPWPVGENGKKLVNVRDL